MKTVEEKVEAMADGEDPNKPHEPKVEEIKEEEESKEEDGKESLMDQLTKPAKTINLEEIEDGEEGEAQDEEGARRLLKGLKNLNVHFHLLGNEEDLKKLKTKKKFRSLFDVGCLSMQSANHISKEMGALFKDRSMVHVESADFLTVMSTDQKLAFRSKVVEKSTEADWKMVTPTPFNHHMLFEVHNPDTEKDLAE